MWMNELFAIEKPIIGLVHLDALPGTNSYIEEDGIESIIRNARYDYLSLVEGGIDSVIFCNENDKPYSRKVEPHIIAIMTKIINSVVGDNSDLPFGVDIQWDPKASLAVALATKASFIRGIVCGTFCGDLGFLTPDTEEIFNYRKKINACHIRVLNNISPEFSDSIDRRPIILRAKTIVNSSQVDGLCVSGVMAGVLTSYAELHDIKDALGEFPVIANTGVNFENIVYVLENVDACIVATCLKTDANPKNRIDVNNVKKLMALARER